jgi:hypothetical protein
MEHGCARAAMTATVCTAIGEAAGGGSEEQVYADENRPPARSNMLINDP